MLERLRKNKRVLFLEISGSIPRSKGIQDVFAKRSSFLDLIQAILKNGKDAYGIFASISTSNLSLSELWEMKRAIEIIKRNGIRTVAFLHDGGIPEVFLSESFDKVYTHENATFLLTGFLSTISAFGEFFNKIKIKLESVKSGRLKSIPDILTKSDVSDEIKEEAKKVITGIYDALKEEVKKFTPDVFIAGILSAKDLLLKGVVDAIVQEPINEIIKKEFATSDVEFPRKSLSLIGLRRQKTTAVLNMFGLISENPSPNFISSSRFSETINRISEDKNIENVIIRVNSRGGDAVLAEFIKEKLKDLSRKKKLITSISSVCASGGYLISLSSTRIFSTPFSIVGSIGVFLIKPYIGDLMEFLGIRTALVSKGELSSIFSLYKELSPKEKKILEELVEYEHRRFIKTVAESRGIPQEHVRRIADGSVFVGQKAKELKLVDDIRSISEIIYEIPENQMIEEYPKINLLNLIRLGTYSSYLSDELLFLLDIARGRTRWLMYFPDLRYT